MQSDRPEKRASVGRRTAAERGLSYQWSDSWLGAMSEYEGNGSGRGGRRLAVTGWGQERDDTWRMILFGRRGRRREHYDGIR